jgi:hypothetical protein
MPEAHRVKYRENRHEQRNGVSPALYPLDGRKVTVLKMLLGKPMPVGAVRTIYANLDDGAPFDPASQIQWLLDSEDRLIQYLEFAREKGRKLSVNIEIDVGLHREGSVMPRNQIKCSPLSGETRTTWNGAFRGRLRFPAAHPDRRPSCSSSATSSFCGMEKSWTNGRSSHKNSQLFSKQAKLHRRIQGKFCDLLLKNSIA